MESLPEGTWSAERLEELAAQPRRSRLVHWIAFAASLVATFLLAAWVLRDWQTLARVWVVLDIGLGIAFAFEFSTRSGFNRDRLGYTLTHIFDFVAAVPALALVHFGVPFPNVYVAVILVARVVRSLDRVLGDGFFQRTVLVMLEGIEEEITSRVALRMLDRVQDALDRGRLTETMAASLARHRTPVLERVKAAHPQDGIAAGLAHITGLDRAIERAEERTYDAIVEVFKSPEVDRAFKDVIASAINQMKVGMAMKKWRRHFGLAQAPLSKTKRAARDPESQGQRI